MVIMASGTASGCVHTEMAAQDRSHTQANRLTRLGGKDMQPWFIAYFFDIRHPYYGQGTPVKKGIHWPVSHDHFVGSSLKLIKVTFLLKLTAD